MAYNYSAYAAAYGQQFAGTYGTQVTTAAAGYGQYGQTSYGSTTSTTSTSSSSTVSTANTFAGYGSAATTTSSSQPSQGTNFNYVTGYGYNYTGDASSGLNVSNAANNALQAFQQSWYSNTSGNQANRTNQTTSASQPQGTQQQQQQYGNNLQTQFMQQQQQQYQQQMAAYQQQYTNNAAGKTEQQQTPTWASYAQNQQQQQQMKTATSTTANRSDAANNMWNQYQQQSPANQGGASNYQQQQKTGVVYRSPMKYNQNENQGQNYGTGAVNQGFNNQGFKAPASNPPQGYNNRMGQQNFVMMNQNFPAGNQAFNAGNQQFKSPSAPGYNMSGFTGNQNVGGSFNQGFSAQNFNRGMGNNMNRPEGPMGMAGPPRGGRMGPMGRGQPLGGNMGFGPGRPGPRDGPDIPPFPQAWHAQEWEGDWQQRGRGYGDGPPDRWNRGGNQRGRFPPQQRMYNNNSRNARGTTGSNRELWSPAGKKSGSAASSNGDKDTKVNVKKEEETVDKEKHPEIKSFLYAWLGARRTRPTYDIRQVGERPNIEFRCDLRVDSFNFVGVGKATSKKEAQTTAAWKFAEFLVKNGDLKDSDLPPKQTKSPDEPEEGEFGDVKDEEEGADGAAEQTGRKRRDSDEKSRSRDRRGQAAGGRDRRNRDRYQNNRNWGNQNRGRPPQMDIPPLMALPVGPWEGPMGPPHMMPPPPMMEWGPHWELDPWGRPMGPPPPPMPMRPMLPPHLRRNQNEYWRRRDIEERMIDMSRTSDWQNPEDMFIHQMIRTQQEAERRHRGNRPLTPLEAMPGEWQSVAQARPVVTSDDRHVMAKHSEIYPQEGELKSLHRIVNTVEQALKLLSDKFVDEDHPRPEAEAAKQEEADKEEKDEKEEDKEQAKDEESVEVKKEADVNVEKDAEKKEGEEEKKDTEDKEAKNTEESANQEEKKEEKRAKIKILKRPKKTPKQIDTRPRVLCGVNRIGPLAKGLLISKDDRVDLALLCGEIPTVKLLDRILEHVEGKLSIVDEEFGLSVESMEEEAGFLVKTENEESPVQVMVTLTAMTLRKSGKKENLDGTKKEKDVDEENKEEEKDVEEGRTFKEETEETKEEIAIQEESEIKEENEKEKTDEEEAVEKAKAEEPDPVGMLPKQKMLDALACLRHTHWFQAKACNIQSCVILTRILRDLQRRDDVWRFINEWPLEVLVYSTLASSDEQMSPGDACRRFLEVISGAILLPGHPGLQDPCDKPKDLLDCLDWQQKEDITRSAQSYLRQLAFREIHKFLGMEKLPPTYKGPEQRQNNPHRPYSSRHAEIKGEEDRSGESNNVRKRRFEHNGDSMAESPKRSLTDEEDTDTQQNLAELSISDEASEGRSALEEAEVEKEAPKEEEGEGDILGDDDVMDTVDQTGETMTQQEEDVLLEKMDS